MQNGLAKGVETLKRNWPNSWGYPGKMPENFFGLQGNMGTIYPLPSSADIKCLLKTIFRYSRLFLRQSNWLIRT